MIQPSIASTACATGTPLIWVPSRNRNDTAPASTSFAPASSRNGTLPVVWVRIFFCIRSSEWSTSARIPRPRNSRLTASR